MAYSAAGLYQVGPGGSGARIWVYSTTDNVSVVVGAGYFSDGDLRGLAAGDVIQVVNTTNNTVNECQVTTVTTGGAATVSEQKSYELLATGAVPAGAKSVELNHATVVIAATIADSADHAGLFVVKDTSASGTAAHTLTLTAGTFDGTNNVATLNAPNEALVVWFDSAGDGTIVENVGSVALS